MSKDRTGVNGYHGVLPRITNSENEIGEETMPGRTREELEKQLEDVMEAVNQSIDAWDMVDGVNPDYTSPPAAVVMEALARKRSRIDLLRTTCLMNGIPMEVIADRSISLDERIDMVNKASRRVRRYQAQLMEELEESETFTEAMKEKLVDTPVAEVERFTSKMVSAIRELSLKFHQNAVSKGFWEDKRSDGECIALIHSELSECLEALRRRNPPSKKAVGYSQAEEEIADVIIRCLDFAEERGWDIGGAMEAKHEYNKGRPRKHGKKF